MKRYISLLLVFAMLFSITACKSDNKIPADSSSSSSDWTPEAPFTSEEGGDEKPDEMKENGEDTTASQEETPLTRNLVIPEGYTLARIGMTLEEMGYCTVAEFIDATQTGDFSNYPLVATLEPDPTRCFDLEGFLYPDTYEIYTEETVDSIIRRLLSNMESKVTAELRGEIEDSGYSVLEILTLASIIEKEAFKLEEMPRISSVLHNRLDTGMKLQCDVTIVYVEGAIKPFIDGDINRYNEHYNTNKTPALPSGPICNPSVNAIKAALNPDDTEYFYFLTDKDKDYFYAETYEEHQVNAEKAGITTA